jgi:hypothetical protein
VQQASWIGVKRGAAFFTAPAKRSTLLRLPVCLVLQVLDGRLSLGWRHLTFKSFLSFAEGLLTSKKTLGAAQAHRGNKD